MAGSFKHEADWTGLILALIFSHEYKHDVCIMSELCVKREQGKVGSKKKPVLSLRYSLRARHLD